MDPLVQFLQRADLDASCLDSTIAEYIVELAKEDGTEEEAWSVLEGCYPELEEAPEQRQGFADVLAQLRRPATSSVKADAQESGCVQQAEDSTCNDGGGRTDREDADINFLREMMPHVSNRGLRYVLHKATHGGRVAAASYLADRCAREGSGLKALETAAEVWERKEQETLRKSKEAERINEEAKRRDKEERDAFKDKIVGRYADETEGTVVKLVVPTSTERKQNTRYRGGKVVTTTGAKVVVENLKPEWDGGSRGKVKTKGKRGKGFV